MKPALVHWCCQDFSTDWDIERTCRTALDLGCSAVELVSTQDYPALANHGLACPMCQIDTGGEPPFLRGFNNPENWERLARITRETILLAAGFGFPNVICFTGYDNENPDDPQSPAIDPSTGAERCAEGLTPLAKFAALHGVTLCLEMLNTRVMDHPMKGHPGYQGDHIDYCAGIVKRVGSPAMKLLFDCYHIQVMDGDLIRRIQTHAALIGHVHIAGNPGRAEPDASQEINYAAVLRALAETGYHGYVGLEFLPTGDPIAGLRQAIELCRTSSINPNNTHEKQHVTL